MATEESNLPASKTDVRGMYNKVEERLKSLKKVTDTPFKTTGVIDFYGQKYNIKTASKVSELIALAGEIMASQKEYDIAAEALLEGAQHPQFEIGGYAPVDIIHDIKIRIGVLSYEEEVKKLKKFRDQIKELFTEEERRKAVLEELAAEFGDIDLSL